MIKTNIDDLKFKLKDANIILGASSVIKNLRKNKLSKVYIAFNTPSNVEDDIVYNAEIAETDVEKLSIANDDLGIAFKRAHSVLAIGVMKD
jgi:ribosomal protein L30E